jgi:hypothetical protein
MSRLRNEEHEDAPAETALLTSSRKKFDGKFDGSTGHEPFGANFTLTLLRWPDGKCRLADSDEAIGPVLTGCLPDISPPSGI